MSAEPPAFDVGAPLAPGVTVLEASAGTGKTYAITGLAVRYVAAGTPLERILLVTFTRMATGELRERVRERLLSVQRSLRRALAGGELGQDPVVRLLAGGGPEGMRLACRRIERALSDFDAATIATTHGFCQDALGGLGIASDLEPGVSFMEDLSDLVSEVLDDLYVLRFHRRGKPPFSRREALAIARLAVANPGAPVAPATGEVPQMRARLADRVRQDLEERKRRLAVMTYDDLLMRLREALRGQDGTAVAERLRRRYDLVLVDEFQDTDPVQWQIMWLAFGQGDVSLVLIADPKQAIYAFRGADVYAYLDAAGQARMRATLTVNRRSDQALLDAYDALFGNAKLGHEGIVYRRVRASGTAEPGRRHGPPLRLRILERGDVECTRGGWAQTQAAREYVAEDLAGDVAALLDSDAEVLDRPGDGGPAGQRRACPGDVAVLVRTNAQAALVMQALERAGIPAVINGAGSVFATESARDWLALLEGLEQPASITRAHAVALTPFLGWRAAEVAEAGELAWEEVHQHLHEWARTLRQDGVASLEASLTRTQALPQRLLARVDGERRLTDLRHIGQLLHAAALEEQLGTTALTGWLRRRILEAGSEGDEERSRRLESDAQAVQVLTIHRSKGLEFPIVYLPYLWDFGRRRENEPVFFHDPRAGNRRTIDVALDGPDFERHRQQHVDEQRGEDLRLAYVALTRARHQAILWWAGTYDSRDSPLGRLVFARAADGSVPPTGAATPTDAAAREAFEVVAAKAPGRVGVETARLGFAPSWHPVAGPGAELVTAEFGRGLDRRWRRTSYSDITAGAHDAWVSSEPEEPELRDEPDGTAALAGSEDAPGVATGQLAPTLDDAAAATVASPLAGLPVGVAAGTLVHQALEAADFAAPDLEAELTAALAAVPGRRAVPLGDAAPIAAGLSAALRTPLGPILGDGSLAGVARADRLDELGFELPLAGGERPHAALTMASLAAVLRQGLPAGDPFRDYAGALADTGLRQSVRGYLTGSLDLVVRLHGADGPRFAVVDYKTNWLAGPDDALTAWHYRPAALLAEMHQRHYALQALLYLVALHRFLRWRVRGYDAERHLAGVAYLFLRGMSGPDTPTAGGGRCGVFAWRPPAALVCALSDVLDGTAEPRTAGGRRTAAGEAAA